MMSYFDFTAKMHSTMLIIVLYVFLNILQIFYCPKKYIHRQEQDKTSCR